MQNEKLMDQLRSLSIQMDDRRRMPPPPIRCEHPPFREELRPPMPPPPPPPPPYDEFAGGEQMPPPPPIDCECPPEPGFHRFPGHRGSGRILMLLSDGDGSTQVELAETMGIRPQSLSELLGKLEDDGLIERRSDSDDRRAQRVFLTDNGRVTAARIKDRHENRTEEFLAPLTEEEREKLSALLEKLLNADRTKPE